MSDNTKIEWVRDGDGRPGATVNAVNGCSVTSPGCTNCYAMKQAHRFPARAGLTTKTNGGMVWTGEVRFNEKQLLLPLGWKRPRRIFWNAHGDLFHSAVPDEWIDRVFAVCALTPQHTHMILTKRSARMLEFVADEASITEIFEVVDGEFAEHSQRGPALDRLNAWPLPNVWLGVSVEDQARADERIPDLLATPAAVRFISAEPLLGPVDLTWIAEPDEEKGGVIDALLGCNWCDGGGRGVDYFPIRPGHEGRKMTRYVVSGSDEIIANRKLDWVICGGESGPGARPMHPDWARSLRDQCAAAGVAFHFKQWGEWAPRHSWDHRRMVAIDAAGNRVSDDLRPQDVGGQRFARIGKKAAGRLLDGVEHNGLPGQPHA